MAAQTDGTVGAGAYFVEASTLAGAFSNPLHLDLVQVVNKDSKVVWNLTADGSTNLNPTSPQPLRFLENLSALPSPKLLPRIAAVRCFSSRRFQRRRHLSCRLHRRCILR
jgi:hypothetical protein